MMKYRLTCECGLSQPVEPRQAGQMLACVCGKALRVPTMLQMKRLPEWEGDDKDEIKLSVPDDATQETVAAAEKKAQKWLSISQKRMGLFIAAGLIFVVAVFFLTRLVHKPDPISVHFKQTTYRSEGRDVQRDSTQTTSEDFFFYFVPDPTSPRGIAYTDKGYPIVINDDVIDHGLTFFGAYTYFEYVKTPTFSDNFYENYEMILRRWKTALVIWGFIALSSLTVALLALFVKESNKQIGITRGEGWQ